MAYVQNEKSTGLDVLTSLEQADLHIVGDVSDSGRAKAITETNLEITIANSTNFVDELIDNDYFTTELANSENFITELTNNTTFQNSVNSFVTNVSVGGGGSSGKPLTYANIGIDNGISDPMQGYIDREAQISQNSTTLILSDPTGNIQSRDVTSDWANAILIVSAVLKAQYLYVFLQGNTSNTYRVYRYTASDLSTGGTLMTIAGQAFSTSNPFTMTSNGTNFYFSNNAGASANNYRIAKYSLSGTTLTYVSTTVCGSSATNFLTFAVDSSGNYITIDNNNYINVFDTTGTLTYTSGLFTNSLGILLNWANTIYGSKINSQIFTKLYIPNTSDRTGGTAKTLIPISAIPVDNSNSAMSISGNTVANVGQIIVPFDIAVNSLSIRIGNSVPTPGDAIVSLFTEDGLSRVFSVTIPTITNPGTIYTVSLSSVSVVSGVYYIMIQPVGSASFNAFGYAAAGSAMSTTDGLPFDVTGKAIMSGTLTVTADTAPSTITPTSITEGSVKTLIVRLDN